MSSSLRPGPAVTSVHEQQPLSRERAPRAQRIERFDTLVLGGGQAGLAASMQLSQRDIDHVILSNEARTGDNWRRRWDSLRLFTPARISSLPGMMFPATPSHLADKDEVANYLETYAARFDLPIRHRAQVTGLTTGHSHFRVTVRDSPSILEARHVIVATGPLSRPRIPVHAELLDPSIHQLHSSAYRNPFVLPEGPVLVVGAGNSGAQIAMELAKYRKVWLAGRSPGLLPRRVLGRDIFDWIWPVISRAHASTRLGRRMRANTERSSDARIGISERALARAHVQRVDRLTGVRGGMPQCEQVVLHPTVIVWATGFRADYDWLTLPVFDTAGQPRHVRGVATDVEGLYFLGMRFQHRVSSSLIGGVGDDAAFIADHIATRSGVEGPPLGQQDPLAL